LHWRKSAGIVMRFLDYDIFGEENSFL